MRELIVEGRTAIGDYNASIPENIRLISGKGAIKPLSVADIFKQVNSLVVGMPLGSNVVIMVAVEAPEKANREEK